MEKPLAIIIPAYKIDFLEHCLSSISNQTNKNFNLYIGNDSSTDNIDSLVDSYRNIIDLTYRRFDANLGSISLVKQWERCIELSRNEEWIWLFSDDDTMDIDCVENFLCLEKQTEDCNIFRFSLQVINKNGEIERMTKYPEEESVDQFILNRFSLKYDSAITNYIFKRENYNKFGFKEFPLAWCSDDASIINFSNNKAIITIPNCNVQWRISSRNISSTNNSLLQKQKVYSRLAYVEWLYTSKKFPFLNFGCNKNIILNWMLSSINTEFNGFTTDEKKKLLIKTELIVSKNIKFYNLKCRISNFRNKIAFFFHALNNIITKSFSGK